MTEEIWQELLKAADYELGPFDARYILEDQACSELVKQGNYRGAVDRWLFPTE